MKDEFRVARYLPAPVEVKTTRKKRTTLEKANKLDANIEKVASTFNIKRREIQQAVNSGDIDQAITTFQRTAYSTLVSIIPIAEREYRKWKRDNQAYALNALIQSARELASDLAAANDRSALAEMLIRESLDPMFREILQQLAQQNMVLKTFVQDKIKPQHVNGVIEKIDMDLRDTAAYLQSIHAVISLQMKRAVQGD
jgi:hypothetical protein